VSTKFTKKEVAGIYVYQWIGWLISVAVIAVSAYFGIKLPDLPPVPLDVGSRGATNLDELQLSTILNLTAQTALTVTDGTAFTPTGTYQPISAAGEVTPTITAGFTAGDLLVLINTSAQTINIADSGTAKLTAAFAMGQYDSLTLWSDGTNWIEVSRANN